MIETTAIAKIKKLIEADSETITRLSLEVTADPPLTAARIRVAAYRRCVNILEETACSTGCID